MSDIVLGKNQYGKAENRVVRIYRDTPRHEIHDVNVSTCLRGDFSAAHLAGDQSDVLPTDTQKQTAYAYAKEKGLESIEDYGLALARHFVHDVEPVQAARIEIEEYAWERATVDGAEHDHTWIRKGQEVRTAAITVDGRGRVGGRRPQGPGHPEVDGFGVRRLPEGRVHVLQPTHDRVMATSLVAQWRFTDDATSTGRPPTRGSSVHADRSNSPPCSRWRCSRRSTRWARRCWRRTR